MKRSPIPALLVVLAVAWHGTTLADNSTPEPQRIVLGNAKAPADSAEGSAYAGTHPHAQSTAAMEAPAPGSVIPAPNGQRRRVLPARKVVLVPPLPTAYPSKPQHPINSR